MENLMGGLLRELNRNRELLKGYEEIGPAGLFGATMIKQSIANGEKAIAEGDVVKMIEAFKDLEESQ